MISRLIKYLGVRGSLFVLLGISASAYALTAASRVLGTIRYAKIAENSTDYPLNNTVRQALFPRTSREAKYKAKASIDTFLGRTDDALQAAIVFLGTQLAFGVQAFALVNVSFVAIWLVVAVGIANEDRRMAHQERVIAVVAGDR